MHSGVLNEKIKTIDGLRGIAILMVIAFHYLSGTGWGNYGWAGVDLFFVISGFLLTGRLLPFLEERRIVWKFYANRILRILPLYFLFLLAFFAVWFALGSNETINSVPLYMHHPASFFFFYFNWILIQMPSQASMHLSPLWSLAVEEQFYLVFPWFILILRSAKNIVIACVVLIAAVCIGRTILYLNTDTHPYQIYWNSLFRCDCFLCGCLLYAIATEWNRLKLRRWIRLSGLLAAVGIIAISLVNNAHINGSFATIGFTLNAILFAAMVFECMKLKGGSVKSVLQSAVLTRIGKISFGIYLFHWPMFLLLLPYTKQMASRLSMPADSLSVQLANGVISLILVLTLANASFHLYERRFLRLKYRL